MLSIIKIKDIATLIGSACGLFAIVLTISSYHEYRLAMAMIFIATISDTLDGYIARKLNQANEFGKELDSLSDFFAFGIAPAIITFSIYTQTPITAMGIDGFSIWIMIIPVFIFILGAIIRLAHFNIMEIEGYVGVPTPTTAGFLVLLTLIDYYSHLAWSSIDGSPLLFNSIIHYSIPFILIILAWFNVTNKIAFSKKVRHKKGWLKIVMAGVMICALAAFSLIMFSLDQAAMFVFVILTILLTIIIILIISGFIFAKKEKKQIK